MNIERGNMIMVIYCVCITKMIVRFYLSPSLMTFIFSLFVYKISTSPNLHLGSTGLGEGQVNL